MGASGAGGYGGAYRIDRPRDAVGHGLIPGRSVRYPAQGVAGERREVGQAAVRMRSIGELRAESRCESRLVLRESR
nr:MAG TPA_asm: hypothetical protein [Caudoviricetes sp.]